jgi:hypothetical protein
VAGLAVQGGISIACGRSPLSDCHCCLEIVDVLEHGMWFCSADGLGGRGCEGEKDDLQLCEVKVDDLQLQVK